MVSAAESQYWQSGGHTVGIDPDAFTDTFAKTFIDTNTDIETATHMSTALFVNLVLLVLMAIGLYIGLVARAEHKQNVHQRKRHRLPPRAGR